MNASRALNYALVLCALFVIGEAAVSNTFRERAKTYCRLTKKCKLKEVNRYDYDLMKISDFPGMQPIGYIVRLQMYVLAPRDAHTVFSPIEKPVWTRDSVYEILVGGWGNNRTLIRRRKQDFDLQTEYTFNVLRRDQPMRLLIEISREGKIQVSLENKRLATYTDESVLQVKYFGFASYDNSPNKYFYDCEGENAYGEEDIKGLCRYADATENEYKEFFPIADVTGIRPKGYIINFPFYIQAARDAHILLTKGPLANREDDEYEILIGGWGNARTIIRRKQGASVLRDVQTLEPLANDKWIAFLIQITSRGDIKIFRKEELQSFKLIAEANDPSPIPVEYISFGSYNSNLVKFYFNCSFSFATPDAVSTATDHPLLARDVPNSINLRNFLTLKCAHYSISEYDYQDFTKLSDIKNSAPDGYILRIVLYIQGSRDANIILTTSNHPNFERDFVYEFAIGVFSNQRILVRKKKGSAVEKLAEIFEADLIKEDEPTKFILEVANSGNIRLWSEKFKSQPLVAIREEVPLPVQYIGFSGADSALVRFYYNCSHINTNIKPNLN